MSEPEAAEKKPDWEAFGKQCWAMVGWPGSFYDIEGVEAFEYAKEHGLVREIKGGFDPENHDDEFGGAEPGDPWYVEVRDD